MPFPKSPKFSDSYPNDLDIFRSEFRIWPAMLVFSIRARDMASPGCPRIEFPFSFYPSLDSGAFVVQCSLRVRLSREIKY